MADAQVDPEKLRAFATRLSRYCLQATITSQGISGQLSKLGTSWRDPQYDQFVAAYQQASRVISGFAGEAEKLSVSLHQDARKAEVAQRITPQTT